jgi:hypothetical protein
MDDLSWSAHALDMMAERRVELLWVEQALQEPDKQWTSPDGNIHFCRAIPERANRVLHLIVNPRRRRIVTLFFDRRSRRPTQEK